MGSDRVVGPPIPRDGTPVIQAELVGAPRDGELVTMRTSLPEVVFAGLRPGELAAIFAVPDIARPQMPLRGVYARCASDPSCYRWQGWQ